MEQIYDAPHLARNPANCAALTPLGFLARAAAIVVGSSFEVAANALTVPSSRRMKSSAKSP